MAGDECVLSDNERKLLDCVGSGKNDEVTRLLAEKDVRVDCRDSGGMTPLQHAAYKGRRETCELLLAHGADVNANYHEHGYTTLMFAAISGNAPIVQLLLEHGAKTSCLNRVGRTASQMAAFVSQHHCVSMINNFFSREQLDRYTVPQGFETEPKLPIVLAPALHKYILVNNLNPVGLSLFLRNHKELLKTPKAIIKVMDLILEKSFKEAGDTSDFFSLKVHYYLCVFKQCEKNFSEKNDDLDWWIKSLLRGRDGDGFREFQEKFIRDVVKRYPYPESTILQHMVRQIAPIKIGDHPTALHVLDASINGPHFADDDAKMCHTCGNRVTKAKCSVCKMACYCDQSCQKMHWFTHKKFCKQLAEEFKQRQELQAAIDEDNRKNDQEEKCPMRRQMDNEADDAGSAVPTDRDHDVNELAGHVNKSNLINDVNDLPTGCPYQHRQPTADTSGFGESET